MLLIVGGLSLLTNLSDAPHRLAQQWDHAVEKWNTSRFARQNIGHQLNLNFR